MKKVLFLSLALISVLTVSCKNVKKTTAEEDAVIETAKMNMSNEALNAIDSLAAIYVDLFENTEIEGISLTEREKMLKPDYLLEPDMVGTLLSKTQKVSGLAVYLAEYQVRKAFDMPLSEAKGAISQLLIELNYPDIQDMQDNMSGNIRQIYQVCKDSGELDMFWKFVYANQIEFLFIISHKPEYFFDAITEDQYSLFTDRCSSFVKAIELLSDFDEESKEIWGIIKEDPFLTMSSEEMKNAVTYENAPQFYKDRLDVMSAQRTKMLAYEMKLFI